MALIHDIGEAIIGDITPSDGVSQGRYILIYLLHLICRRG
jgi:5'-deoxynucleotidase YfbR-like HD superfamily hydrolase